MGLSGQWIFCVADCVARSCECDKHLEVPSCSGGLVLSSVLRLSLEFKSDHAYQHNNSGHSLGWPCLILSNSRVAFRRNFVEGNLRSHLIHGRVKFGGFHFKIPTIFLHLSPDNFFWCIYFSIAICIWLSLSDFLSSAISKSKGYSLIFVQWFSLDDLYSIIISLFGSL